MRVCEFAWQSMRSGNTDAVSYVCVMVVRVRMSALSVLYLCFDIVLKNYHVMNITLFIVLLLFYNIAAEQLSTDLTRTKSFLRQATEMLVESSSSRASVGGSGGGADVDNVPDEYDFLCRELARQTARADEWKANGVRLAQVSLPMSQYHIMIYIHIADHGATTRILHALLLFILTSLTSFKRKSIPSTGMLDKVARHPQ